MTHLQPTTPVAGAGRDSSPQADDASTLPTQDPPYPPGLGFSPLFRSAARARGMDVRGEAVVGHGNGSNLLNGLLVGLGLHGLAVDRATNAAQTTRILPAVCLGLPWPPLVGAEPVLHWPPQVALHEERMEQPGRQLSMLDDLDLGVKNLKPLNLERACAGFSCTLCDKTSHSSPDECDEEAVHPRNFMDFSFLDEDDCAPVPTRYPTPAVEEDGSELRSREESESASPDNDSASIRSSESQLSPVKPRIPLCPMKDRWFRADMTSDDLVVLWCEAHI